MKPQQRKINKKDVLKSPTREWNDTEKLYDRIWLIPAGTKHDSGFMHIAIEGGYRKPQKDFLLDLPDWAKSQIWLDPLFWQCLGKSLGWEEKRTIIKAGESHRNGKTYKRCGYSIPAKGTKEGLWRINWHRFIDHLAEGKDPESFFIKLLK